MEKTELKFNPTHRILVNASIGHGYNLVTIDVETDKLYGPLLGGAISLQPEQASYYTAETLTKCLNNCPEWRTAVAHNAKYEMKILAADGYDWERLGTFTYVWVRTGILLR